MIETLLVPRPRVIAPRPPSYIRAMMAFGLGAGSTLFDKSRYRNHGTISGADWATGRYGAALSFNGSSDYVDCGTAAGLSFSGSFTLEAWIKPDSSKAGSHQGIVSKYEQDVPTYKGWTLWLTNADVLGCRVGADTSYKDNNGTTNIQDDAWHHVVLVSDGSYLRLFLDGQPEGTDVATSSMVAGQWATTIGCRHLSVTGYDVYFKGLIDVVRVLSIALAASEVLARYNATK